MARSSPSAASDNTGGDSDGRGVSRGLSRRKRIRQACLNCRRKKVRCGGEQPICTFCRRLSQPCIYTEDGRSARRAPSAPTATVAVDETTHEAAYDDVKGELEVLSGRLRGIENILENIVPTLTSLAASISNQQSQGLFHETTHSTQAPDGEMMMNESSMERTSQNEPQPPPTSPLNIPLPPTHTLLLAADVYFRFSHNQPYSLFHEATLRERLMARQVPAHLTWAILAAARRFSTLPDLPESLSHDALSLVKVSWDCMDLPWSGVSNSQQAVQILQTIVLLVNIEHPAGQCASSYMKLGFALRIALHSKLDKEDQVANESLTFREERKRVFWSLYLQDKLISLARERTPVIRDEMCRLSLPCSESAFRECREEDCPTLDDLLGERFNVKAVDRCSPLALIYVMASALSRASGFALNENRFSELGVPWNPSSPYTAISALLLQLEDHFGLGEPAEEALMQERFNNLATDHHTTGSYIYAKALFHLSHCLLHHPFLLHQRLARLHERAPASFARAAWSACRTHAKAITELKDLRSHNVLILPSLYGYCFMIAGTIHALSSDDKQPALKQEANFHFDQALEFLHDLSRYWRHAALMATRLQRFKQAVVGHTFLINGRSSTTNGPDLDLMWQSVDYHLLSTPTRPGSPRDNALGNFTSTNGGTNVGCNMSTESSSENNNNNNSKNNNNNDSSHLSQNNTPSAAFDIDFSTSQLFDFPLADLDTSYSVNAEQFGELMGVRFQDKVYMDE